ncbi:hypothetical protein [Caproicibacter fermentans]|uniref:Rad50/SbcC-type AAA domain-containing protein n=1 Tax=Caproicibacter fermentans TaxID=2576756 RepID=A0A7G8T8L3_9FIRM|nr:hypothetical protein [Caproicibacter fermentans]QNK39954.1 hypothetical protein HCR03_14745 [Caproicibacter fermentans]
MIFKSITITEGQKSKTYTFSENANLIHSNDNTVGKTTLLRLMLYSLGYPIPNTKNIKFEKCSTQTILEEKSITYHIKRENEYLIVNEGTKSDYYILPAELNQFHSLLFGTQDNDILNNLLGTFYMDQEKGWTLLNRGKVIGSIGFNIEQLILGLSGRDYEKLQAELQLLERDIKKYQQMKDVAQYQQEVYEEKGDIIHDTYDESLQRDLAVCSFDVKSLRRELTQVTNTLSDNISIGKFIEKMSLRVKAPDGTEIPVNKDTIVGLIDNTDFLLSRKKLLVAQISKLDQQITKLRNLIYYQSQQPTSETLIEAFDKNLSQISIDAVAVDNILNELNTRQSEVKRALTELAKNNNSILEDMYDIIETYGIELGLTKYMSSGIGFVFTHNLKELSGATLMKMVFAFKMSYIKAVDSVLNVKLPIILDSPSGKEMDKDNIQKLMNILDRDFSDHQIIIASIYDYSLKNLNRIEMGRRVVC